MSVLPRACVGALTAARFHHQSSFRIYVFTTRPHLILYIGGSVLVSRFIIHILILLSYYTYYFSVKNLLIVFASLYHHLLHLVWYTHFLLQLFIILAHAYSAHCCLIAADRTSSEAANDISINARDCCWMKRNRGETNSRLHHRI